MKNPKEVTKWQSHRAALWSPCWAFPYGIEYSWPKVFNHTWVVRGARPGFLTRRRMQGGVRRWLILVILFLSTSREQKDTSLAFVFTWLLFGGFCFSPVKSSRWVQSSCPIEVRSQAPPASPKPSIGGTLEKSPFVLFWSFCFFFRKALNEQINSRLLQS